MLTPFTDDELDDLDPCCRKEVLGNRKEAAIKKNLLKDDRSNIRMNTIGGVFAIANRSTCNCCSNTLDYPLLKQMRNNKETDTGNSIVNDCNSNLDLDSDDDDELYDSQTMTVYEQERLREMSAVFQKIKIANERGYGLHIEESPSHLMSLVFKEQSAVVCHLYSASSRLCALLDLSLEELARTYPGTRFRRMSVSHPHVTETFRGLLSISHMSRPSLICFNKGKVCATSLDLTAFGDEETVYVDDLRMFLDHAKVLYTELPDAESTGCRSGIEFYSEMEKEDGTALIVKSGDEQEEEQEEEKMVSYCSLKSCGRTYPHTHVEKGGHSLTSIGSGGGEIGDGEEPLAKNYFLTI